MKKFWCRHGFWPRVFIPGLLLFIIFMSEASAEKDPNSSAQPLVIFNHQIPFGQGKGGWVCENSTVSVLLRVESRSAGKLTIDYQLFVPNPLELPELSAGLKVKKGPSGSWLSARFPLMTRWDQWFRVIEVRLPDGLSENPDLYLAAEARIHCLSDGQVLHEKTNIPFRVVNEKRLRESFQLVNFILPADEQGKPQKKLKTKTVLLQTENRISRWLGGDQVENPQAAAYAAVEIANALEDAANLLVRLEFLDPRTRQPAEGFDPILPQGHEGLGRGGGGVYQLVCLPAKGNQRAILPIYAREHITLPGHYLARLSIRHFGSDGLIGQFDQPIEVMAPQWVPLMITLFSLAAAVSLIIMLYWKRQYFLRLKTREMITIALFGTIIFAVVNVPGTLLWRFAHVFLGPFSFFITGFFHEIIFYMLLTSLVVLIPKVGAVTLVIVIKSLMSDLLFGGFSATSFLNMGVAALLLEAAYFLSGLTRPKSLPGPREGIRHAKITRSRILTTALVCGLADMLISYVNFNISMLLYRLYYAGWYIAVYLFISGFLYTFIAVPLGFTLSKRLSFVGN